MTKISPSIYSRSTENIKQKIEDLIEMGYTREEILKMIKEIPAILSYSIDTMKQKRNDLEELGFTKEEVIYMTKKLPALFGYSKENIKQKVEYLRKMNLEFIIFKDPKYLIQSLELTQARMNYFYEQEIKLDETNFSKLYYSHPIFEKQFGISKKELLEKYGTKAIQKEKTTK